MAKPEIISQRISRMPLDKLSQRELRTLLEGLFDGVNAIAAKLDADATVTDTNYAATFLANVKKS